VDPGVPPVFVGSCPYSCAMGSGGDNLTGADNQQGRPPLQLSPDYIAGFAEGEGASV
jgi:hypothetical protein